MKKSTLTRKQQNVLDFIQRYFDANHCYPLIREVQAGCAITSYKSALDRLNALDRKGFLKRLPNKHRGMRLTRRIDASGQPVAVADPAHPSRVQPVGAGA